MHAFLNSDNYPIQNSIFWVVAYFSATNIITLVVAWLGFSAAIAGALYTLDKGSREREFWGLLFGFSLIPGGIVALSAAIKGWMAWPPIYGSAGIVMGGLFGIPYTLAFLFVPPVVAFGLAPILLEKVFFLGLVGMARTPNPVVKYGELTATSPMADLVIGAARTPNPNVAGDLARTMREVSALDDRVNIERAGRFRLWFTRGQMTTRARKAAEAAAVAQAKAEAYRKEAGLAGSALDMERARRMAQINPKNEEERYWSNFSG